ncbi:unnamed protein product, partial [Gadus morhua 'NCC']
SFEAVLLGSWFEASTYQSPVSHCHHHCGVHQSIAIDRWLTTADKVFPTPHQQTLLTSSEAFIGKDMAQPVCHEDQYGVGDRCCYACDPGSRVYKDCQEKQTNCRPCAETTFHRGLNRDKHCTPCTRCDAERGLRLKKVCTKTSNTLCETLDGYFCSDPLEGGCRAAQRHSVSCSPGHHIGQYGTADKDTECLKCIHGTFSNGLVTSCQPHTNCESLGLYQIQPGTDSTDSVCGHLSNEGADLIPIQLSKPRK